MSGIPHKVEIQDSLYDEETGLIFMKVRFIEKDIVRQFCWPPDDFKNALNIKGEVTAELWIDFCSKIKGKTINMVCEFVGDPESPFVTNAQMQKYFDKAKENFSNYNNFFD